MSTLLFGPLISFFCSLIVAIVAARLTVQLALKRFYSEKWWERKSNAYASIIEALHHLKNHADTNLTFVLEGKELPEAGAELLTRKLQEAMAELRKQRDVGDFVISDKAVAMMDRLMGELDASTRTNFWQEHLELKLSAITACLTAMRSIARKDLRIF